MPVIAGAILAAGLLPAAATAADPPVALRLAVADDVGRPSDPYVRAFADEVAARSGGSVTVDVTWDAGSLTEQGFERGVANLVTDGTFDLGLAAGRAWDDVGIHALKALQAPFLIDTDALAEAVAVDPLADDLLAAMGEAGVVGLALWPEDLRHPVAFEPCIPPITSPEQLAGQTVRAIPSDVTIDLLETLGATHIWVDGYQELVETCQIQAAESGLLQGQSLPGRPTFTGDVVFFPKFQVLAAGAAAFDRLTETQRSSVRDAARAVRDLAIAEHATDADAAEAWCANGGSVVVAGPDGVNAFSSAAQPVFDRLAQDPDVAAAIEAIGELKSSVEPGPAISPCTAPPQPTDQVTASGVSPGLGTWRTERTAADLMAAGLDQGTADMLAGTPTLVFLEDGTWTFAPTGGDPQLCGGPWTYADGVVRLRFVRNPAICGTLTLELEWSESGAGHALVRVMPGTNPIDTALFNGEWMRIE
jgi:TRAP-type C4-dicarboxylate transport system substrate-binding protein